MAYELRDNTGSLFRVEEDKKRERGPDYSGKAMIGGVEYFMDAWLKTSANGQKWMSFAFKAKEQAAPPAPARPAPKPATAFDDMDDDIPF